MKFGWFYILWFASVLCLCIPVWLNTVSCSKCNVPKVLKSSKLDFSSELSPRFRFHVLVNSNKTNNAALVAEKFKAAHKFVDVPVDQIVLSESDLLSLFQGKPLDIDETLSKMFFDESIKLLTVTI